MIAPHELRHYPVIIQSYGRNYYKVSCWACGWEVFKRDLTFAEMDAEAHREKHELEGKGIIEIGE